MQTMTGVAERRVARVESKVHTGGDAQVDDRNVAIMPLTPAATDPFLLLGEDWFSTSGFDWHPHRGIETVTFVVDGVLEQGDSLGNTGALTTGDVQWMTAGRGIIHRELAYRNEGAHVLQLWVNLPPEAKMVATRYQDLRATTRPVIARSGVSVDLISGAAGGVRGPAMNHWPVSGAVITLEPNASYEHELPGRDRAFFYVLSGEVDVAGRRVAAGEIAWSEPVPWSEGSTIRLTTTDGNSPNVVMAYSGQPIEQPVAMGGPFVMNTQDEIEQAFRDFRAGEFGDIPRLARVSSLEGGSR